MEDQLLRSCTVFSGDFSLEAAEAIIGSNIASALDALVEKHLLVSVVIGGETWLFCPDDVIRLVAAPPDRALIAKHAEYYLSRAADGLSADDTNVRTALRRILDAKLSVLLAPQANEEKKIAEAAPTQFKPGSNEELILRADRDFTTLQLGQEKIDLSKRAPLRRLIAALAEHRQNAPGEPIETHALITHVWGSDPLLPDAAINRLRNAIAWLRKLGLGQAIVTLRNGYLLHTGVQVEAS